ncbi:DUF6515 family protein [Vibrio fortis]|uniref:DUF6515 family protein n=1 Tax=Vibrio fortis TaxID=212667 RepID=UPI0040678812
MFKAQAVRGATLILVTAGLIFPLSATAKPHPVYKPSKKIVVVKPVYRPIKKVPKHRSYYYYKMPKHTSYIVLAGISYAVIDNVYYKRSGDQYIYIENPPVTSSSTSITTTTTTTSSSSNSDVGSLVDKLPSGTTTVTIDDATFYVTGGDWYAPIAGSKQFVIVEPQL